MSAMQEINLYQPVSKGVRGMLSARSTGIVLALVGSTLLGLYAFAWWQVDKLQDAVQVVRNQQQAQAAMAAAQGPQLDALTDEDLETLIGKLSTSIDAKACAIRMLASESEKGPAGFSTRLRAFGTRHIDGIWLERVTFGPTNDWVAVSGSTDSPDYVPRYLRSLASDPALQGGEIDDFVIEKPSAKRRKEHPGLGRLSFRAGHKGLVVPKEEKEEQTQEEES